MKNVNDLFSWYENLSPKTLDQIDQYYTKDVYFKDPFNEFADVELLKNIYAEMFEKMENPHFIFIDKVIQDEQLFLTWDFNFVLNKKAYTIHGGSHLKLNKDNLIQYHRDYWDVGEEVLMKIPVVKNLYSAFRNKLSST